MIVLSLFDGIACSRVALERAGIVVEEYYASEIEPSAINIALKNYPDIKQIGDITKLKFVREDDGVSIISKETNQLLYKTKGNIDLIIGGSPCQDLSKANNKQKGLEGEKSKLFFNYIDILKEVKPTWFVLENVASMTDENRDIMSEIIGCQPLMIDAAYFSAQSRKRYFWTNIPNISLNFKTNKTVVKDILVSDDYNEYPFMVKGKELFRSSYNDISAWEKIQRYQKSNIIVPIRIGYFLRKRDKVYTNSQFFRIYSIYGKSTVLIRAYSSFFYINDNMIRRLEPIEEERLQGLPDNYTQGISKLKRCEAIGNAFNVDVITYILKHIKNIVTQNILNQCKREAEITFNFLKEKNL